MWIVVVTGGLRKNYNQVFFPFQVKKQGFLCRGVKTDCVVVEYCPGDARDVSALRSLVTNCLTSLFYNQR